VSKKVVINEIIKYNLNIAAQQEMRWPGKVVLNKKRKQTSIVDVMLIDKQLWSDLYDK